MHKEIQQNFSFDNHSEELALLGNKDRHLKRFKEAFDIKVHVRNGVLGMRGDPNQVHQASLALDDMLKHYRSSKKLRTEDVENYIHSARFHGNSDLAPSFKNRASQFVTPKTEGQRNYLEGLEKNDVVFCIGPAGTGKTYLAVAMALGLLRSGEVKKIILARPAVEAGEKLGFLPGDMQDKVNPFLRPLYDALHDMLDYGQVKRYLERDIIEVAPLAFMRGRTLNHSLIILDEAQNSTSKQMKMFLTRIGVGSKAVITGDVTQTDLPEGECSGLFEARDILKDIQGIKFVYLDQRDVVRHHIVQKIVVAYENYRQPDQKEK